MAADRRLVLVKHSAPVVDPSVSAKRWRLSDDGRALAVRLAEHLRAYVPTRVVTSIEPKALETGELLAEALGLPMEPAEGLEEQNRSVLGFLPWEDVQAGVARLFELPDEPVFGRESAKAATDRFAAALGRVLRGGGMPVVVAHGTVISLYLASVHQVHAYELWTRLGTPSYVVLGEAGIEKVVPNID